jgi:hypothetical protein
MYNEFVNIPFKTNFFKDFNTSMVTAEHPLDSIAIGIVEARSFLFSYGNAGAGSDSDKKKKSGAGHTYRGYICTRQV